MKNGEKFSERNSIWMNDYMHTSCNRPVRTWRSLCTVWNRVGSWMPQSTKMMTRSSSSLWGRDYNNNYVHYHWQKITPTDSLCGLTASIYNFKLKFNHLTWLQETAGDMKSLIVYCRAISIKPWSFHRQAQTSVSNMFSFGEPSALRRCYKYPIGEWPLCSW